MTLDGREDRRWEGDGGAAHRRRDTGGDDCDHAADDDDGGYSDDGLDLETPAFDRRGRQRRPSPGAATGMQQ